MNTKLELRIAQAEQKAGNTETKLHRMLRGLSELDTPVNKSKFVVAQKEDRTSTDNIVFDSLQEKIRYAELLLLQKTGHITDLELQKRFILLPDFLYHKKKIKGIAYLADFYYVENTTPVIEEWKVKATRTRDYILKYKWMLSLYPQIDFREMISDEDARR